MAGELLLDTSGLVSILDRSQAHHAACVETFRSWRRPVLTTEAVLTEATHLLGRTRGGKTACLRFVLDGGAVLVPGSPASVRRCETILAKYAALDLDYADATLVVLAEDVRSQHVLTLDRRDFSAVRWSGKKAFRVHPAL